MVVSGKTGRPSNGNKKELQYRKNDKKTRRLRDGAVSWAKNSMPGQRWLAVNATAICMDFAPPMHSMKSGVPLVAALISPDYAGFLRPAHCPLFPAQWMRWTASFFPAQRCLCTNGASSAAQTVAPLPHRAFTTLKKPPGGRRPNGAAQECAHRHNQ
jgi:hypothetical protein